MRNRLEGVGGSEAMSERVATHPVGNLLARFGLVNPKRAEMFGLRGNEITDKHKRMVLASVSSGDLVSGYPAWWFVGVDVSDPRFKQIKPILDHVGLLTQIGNIDKKLDSTTKPLSPSKRARLEREKGRLASALSKV